MDIYINLLEKHMKFCGNVIELETHGKTDQFTPTGMNTRVEPAIAEHNFPHTISPILLPGAAKNSP